VEQLRLYDERRYTTALNRHEETASVGFKQQPASSTGDAGDAGYRSPMAMMRQLLTVGLLGTPGLVSEDVTVSSLARRPSTLLTGRRQLAERRQANRTLARYDQTQYNYKNARNAWQSLACSPTGIAVLPPSEQ